jgi:hypothetical protein
MAVVIEELMSHARVAIEGKGRCSECERQAYAGHSPGCQAEALLIEAETIVEVYHANVALRKHNAKGRQLYDP